MTSPSPAADSLFAARTEKGLREENQDAMTNFQSPFGTVYLIADGMGGVQGGAEASLITAESFRKYLTSFPADLPIAEALQRASSATNTEIRLRSQSGGPSVTGMGSTIVLAVFPDAANGLRATIAHIGDSRAYSFRDGVLRRLTRDHSTVQRLVDSHRITPQEARQHPDANVITRALGPYEEVEIEVSEQSFEPDDILMLCSDGLCGYAEDAQIAVELSRPRDLGQTADALIALALRSGGTDNVTVQLCRVQAHGAAARVRGSGKTAMLIRSAPRLPMRQMPKAANLVLRVSPAKRYFGCFLAGALLGALFTALLFRMHPHWNRDGKLLGKHESVVTAPRPASPGPPSATPKPNPASATNNISPSHDEAAKTSGPK